MKTENLLKFRKVQPLEVNLRSYYAKKDGKTEILITHPDLESIGSVKIDKKRVSVSENLKFLKDEKPGLPRDELGQIIRVFVYCNGEYKGQVVIGGRNENYHLEVCQGRPRIARIL